MRKLLLLLFTICDLLLFSSPLENVPVKLTQPDGSEFFCYTSGDEFYHWLHDIQGNMIIQDSVSHYYCYRVIGTDSLIAANKVVKSHYNFVKHSNKIIQERQKNIQLYNQVENIPYKFLPNRNRAITTINNLVVFIIFSDQDDYTETIRDNISTMYIDSATNANSLKQYFWTSSYNQLKVNSYFYPIGTSTYSYQDVHPRAYYCPYSEDNPIGYTDAQRKNREDSLLVRAITSIQNQIPSNLNVDSDNDGRVDNICFIVKGGTTAWNTLLWPHKWSLIQKTYINGKRVYTYNFQLSNFTTQYGVGVLCHEFGHTLGLPDLYHGYPDSLGHTWNPIGSWDIMASNGYYPQQTSGYMKYKYLHWIDSLPVISSDGRYSLYPMSSTKQCYKVAIDGSNEYLYLEYRKKTQVYDTYVPNSGLLIYRINPSKHGNFYAVECGGKNDEIYVYRRDGNFITDGSLSLAPFCTELNSTSFGRYTNPQQFLSTAEFGNVYISDISGCDSVISFNINICPIEDITYTQQDIIPTYTKAKSITTNGSVIINADTQFKATMNILLNDGFEVTYGTTFEANVSPCGN